MNKRRVLLDANKGWASDGIMRWITKGRLLRCREIMASDEFKSKFAHMRLISRLIIDPFIDRPASNGHWVFPLSSTKVNYLHWQLKWLWPRKKKGGREEKRGGIILLPCDSHLPLRFWKWQEAECFCLLINISEHYTWNAPVTLNIGPVRTPRLFLSDMSSTNARWKLENRYIKPPPPAPHPPFLMKSVGEWLEDTGAIMESSTRKHKGNIRYVMTIGTEGRNSRGAKG